MARVADQAVVPPAGGQGPGGAGRAGKRLRGAGGEPVPIPPQLLPYGFSSSAAQGLQAVLLDGYCAGLPNAPDTALEPGEVRLYWAGGAEILLGRDGAVTINGQVFPPKEEE